jgi:hypothetical protein
MHRILIGTLTLALAAAFAGCAQTPAVKPEVDTGALTFDGLAQVKNPAAGIAWMRPDFNLAGYTKVMLRGAGIEYRPIPRSSTDKLFPLTDKQKARLRQIVGDAFKAELAKSTKFQLVNEPGPDVLTVWGGLIDVVSHVPPEKMGNSDIYLRSVGEATLVLELRDSQSNAPLVRILDRRAAGTSPAMMQESNSVTNWSEVQRVARLWAVALRTKLDDAAVWAQ